MSIPKRKLWICITAIVLIVSLLASIVLVFADEYIIPEVTPTPLPVSTPVPTPSESLIGGAFTTPGNGEVQDHVTDGSTKEFYTVQTHNGNTFYMVIDKERIDDNVYMLSQIDENDLMEFVKDAEPETPAVVIDETVTPEKEKSGGHGWILLLLLLLLGGGAAYWYFMIERPRQSEQTISTEDRFMETPEDDGEIEDLPILTEDGPMEKPEGDERIEDTE